jgi:membrane-associated phospholipid phosphatase
MNKRVKRAAALAGAAATVLALSSPAFADNGNGNGNTNQGAHGDAGAKEAFQPDSGQLVVAWNQELLKIEQTTPSPQPATIHPTRSFALLHAAIYDAVVSITHADAPYAFQVNSPDEARPDAAAAQAAHDTLVSLFPSFKTPLDTMLTNELANIADSPAKQAGIDVGKQVATQMLALRANDGSANKPPAFTPTNPPVPGGYQLTPPNFPNPAFTGWAAITPWVLQSASQFRPPPPPALSSPEWAKAINEVESLGQDTSTTRTADQTQIGKFWAPPIWNTWNEIADGQVTARHTNLETASHLFADLNLSFADSVIAFYDAKYTYNLWRPITAIRAGTPGNAAVNPANPTWNALANTAPDPSYPGAHSTVSEAGATVLAAFFGDPVDIKVSSDALPNVTRSFDSFQAVAIEAGLSRIYAGQHTRLDHEAGLALGRSVADNVLEQAFGPRGD